ncbi:PLP-dependent transferase [Conexibacter sp. JD483]|uniref:aminotransferase class I/II-fold pyridoxal phosphate-dependent enzyme n=1 Tax=unclassified Conexibacter TaxID=2627773 RepID=UPI0027216968|nr:MULTISPECIES: PLP-dependent transferase [unclassified Conexibacter]MDO8188341.1 PLP-dependent transferase [Conexibacter sp. CPCC 205706]MDO8200711.1 PLP-dependent transferase [Conexibacter sp. CPCC 205762]MDR9369435.1 PLP-dependent transferase [Conexibacter sp. JD483]
MHVAAHLTAAPAREASTSASASPAQHRAPYLEALAAHGQRKPGRMHVPGHGGGSGADPALLALLGDAPFRVDLPRDLSGVDAGPSPTPYDQAEELAAAAHGAGRTWFLTNGATQGNHAICLALAGDGARVLVQRNCHGSVVDGLVLSGAEPAYALPEYDARLGIAGPVTPATLRAALAEDRRIAVVVLVSPTYYGEVADVAACAQVAHEAGAVLVVDGAWGPHFGFHPALPQCPLRLGADVLLTSTHKHAGSLTQSAMLHVAPGREAIQARLERSVRMLRSTSPSSLLLASLDASRRQLALRGGRVLGDAIAVAARLRERLAALPGCAVRDAADPLRVAVDIRGTGAAAEALAEALRDGHDVHPELVTPTCLLFVVPLGLTPDGADDVADALAAAIAETASVTDRLYPVVGAPALPAVAISPRAAFLGATEVVPRTAAVGRICAEAISAYPPGIPLLLPGERIAAVDVDALLAMRAAGARLHGAADPQLSTLTVVAE